MNAGTIAEGPNAGDAGSLGTAATPGKIASTGRTSASTTDRTNTLESGSLIAGSRNTVTVPGSGGSVALFGLGAITLPARSIAEQQATWKEEFAEQASRLADTTQASSDGSDSQGLAALTGASPDFRPLNWTASLGKVQPGVLPAGAKTQNSERAFARSPLGKASENAHPPLSHPVPAVLTTASGLMGRTPAEDEETTSEAKGSMWAAHTSNPSRVQIPHAGDSSSMAPAFPLVQANTVDSLPVVFPAFSSSAFQPAAESRSLGLNLARFEDARSVAAIGSSSVDSVLPETFGTVPLSPGAAPDGSIRPLINEREKQPAEGSLIASGIAASAPDSSVGIGLESSAAAPSNALNRPGAIGGDRHPETDSLRSAANWTAARDAVSQSPQAVDSGVSGVGKPAIGAASSIASLSPSPARVSGGAWPATALQSASDVAPASGRLDSSAAQELASGFHAPVDSASVDTVLQAPGVVHATVAGAPRVTPVRPSPGAPKELVVDSSDSATVAAAVSSNPAAPDTRTQLRAYSGAPANPETAQPSGTESMPAAPSGQHGTGAPSANLPSTPAAPGVPERSPAVSDPGEPLQPAAVLQGAGRSFPAAAVASSTASGENPNHAKSKDVSASVGSSEFGLVSGASTHGAGAVLGVASFLHSGLSETAANGSIPPAIGQGSGQGTAPGNADSGRNPFEAIDSQGRVAAGSSTPDAAHELQVGYQDPVLGYVELRAHADGRGVHAALETQSAAAGDALTGHLGALEGWMNERHTPVESLTVSTLASPADSSSAQHGKGSTQNGNAGSHAGGGSSGDGGNGDRGASSGQYSAPSSGVEYGPPAVPAPASRASLGAFAAPALPGGSSFSVVV
jgi:hypothetical protein